MERALVRVVVQAFSVLGLIAQPFRAASIMDGGAETRDRCRERWIGADADGSGAQARVDRPRSRGAGRYRAATRMRTRLTHNELWNFQPALLGKIQPALTVAIESPQFASVELTPPPASNAVGTPPDGRNPLRPHAYRVRARGSRCRPYRL